MAYFIIKGLRRDKWVVEAADESAALTAVKVVFSGVNPKISDYDADFSKYNATLAFTFVIQANQNGIDYYVSANSQAEAITAFNTTFGPGITMQSCELKKDSIKLDLIQGVAAFKKMYYVNVHHNGRNSDYTEGTQAADIALIKSYNFNGARNDYNANFQSADFAPVDGTANVFFKFAQKLQADNLELLPVISSSHAIFTPANPAASYVAKQDSRGITAAEYTNLYNKLRAHGVGFANRLLPYRNIVRYIEWGSENDVMQETTKLLSGSGVRPIAPYQLDGNGVPYWTTTYNGSDIIWPAYNFGMLLYGCAGFMAGVLSVIPDMEFMYNYSERHYGQAIAISRDGLKLFPDLYSKMTVVAPHNYSDHENGTDITGTFIKKTANATGVYFNNDVAPDGVKMAHACIDRAQFFVTSRTDVGFKKIFISETGYNVDKNGPPDGTNHLLFYQNYLIPYQNDPRNMGIAFFQLKRELISRASSSNAEWHFGIDDSPALQTFLQGYKPPNT